MIIEAINNEMVLLQVKISKITKISSLLNNRDNIGRKEGEETFNQKIKEYYQKLSTAEDLSEQ